MTSTLLQQAVEARRSFEAWYEADAMPCEADWFKRDPDAPDEYDSAHTQVAWKAWQAALQQQPEPVAGTAVRRTVTVETLRQHWLHAVECDHATGRDKPHCACSLVDLGWHPSIGAAVEAWLAHVAGAPPALQQQEEPREVAPRYEQMRLTLIGQVHELIDIAERHAWIDDAEERRRTEGAIAHARKVTAPYNYNGGKLAASPSPQATQQAMPPKVAEQFEFFKSLATNPAYYRNRLGKLLAWIESPSPQDFTLPMVEEGKGADSVPASHPLSVMCGCAKCQATFKAEADARGVQASASALPAKVDVSEAMARYLRRCRSGGLTKKESDLIGGAVEDAQRLGYFDAPSAGMGGTPK